MTYKIQIDDTVREATSEEAARIEQYRRESAEQVAAIKARAAALVSARAKLAALGLSEAEVAALLGA
jgi:hypothetical protein